MGAPGKLVVGCAGPARAEARAVASLAPVAEGGLRAGAAARLAVAVHPHIALQPHTDALMAHFYAKATRAAHEAATELSRV